MSLNITKVNEEFSTTSQIAESDIPEIAALGFKAIINHRPDGEGGAEQPLSESIKNAAEKAGIAYLHIPVIPGNITPDNVAICQAFLAEAPKPVLGFCKTGMRASGVYQRASVPNHKQSPLAKISAWMKDKCLIRRLWRTIKGTDSCKVCSIPHGR